MNTIEQVLLSIVFIGSPIAFAIGLVFYIKMIKHDKKQNK